MRGAEFAELSAFSAVVEHGSFTRAAAHLRISPSALSQTIRQLEARLGVRLLNRTTRSVAPTAAGARLHARLAPVAEELDAAVAEAMTATGRAAGLLRINVPRAAAWRLVAPRLRRFHEANPDVVLDLMVEDRLTDIVAGRFDAGIRIGERLEKDMIAVRLSGDMEMLCVASPDYIARRGLPKAPADLHRHACINWRWPTDGSIYRWEFEKGAESLEIAVDGPLITTEQEVALQAMLQGLGVLYTFDERIYDWIAEGRCVRVLEDWSPGFPGFFLYYPDRRHPPAALRAFIDCLLDRDLRPAAASARG
jgi:DNA-binding transcriptional LysR family regulator